MLKYFVLCLFLLLMVNVNGQETMLPADFRQHNLTQFNSSLFNPTYSFDGNLPRSVSLWSRWQWQSIDADPTTLLFNYTQKLGARSAAGAGYFQHNTGIFLNSGGVLNFAYAVPLGQESNLIVGANVFAFQQKLADDRFVPDDQIDIPLLGNDENNFIAQFSPGLRLQVNGFNMGMTIENAFEQNFTDSDRVGAARIFSGAISNDFPVFLFDEVSYFRPMAYIRAIANEDTQYGLTALFSNPKFWVQGGYNNFYGISGGAGVTLFDKFSLGGLVEFGLDSAISEEDPTFEIVLSYHFGKQEFEVKEKEEKKSVEERMKEVEERRRLAEEEKERQRLEEERRLAQARQDSITNAREALLAAERQKARLDSIDKAMRDQEVEILPDEKYEEVVTSDGLEPGFYLIANVFGTKKYFENFMKTLRTKGLEPKSFYRSLNKYNYVYLERYNTIGEARAARDSNFGGKYTDALWIFRVRGQ